MVNQICLTGSTGFVGINMQRLLKKHETSCYCWDRNNPKEFAGANILLHFAGRAHKMNDTAQDPLAEFRKVNRDLTLSLAEEAIRQKMDKFIFISSVKVMGERPGIYDESVPPEPNDPYGLSKWEAEQGLQKLFANSEHTQCVIIRPPMIYGPENKGNMLPLLKAATKGIPLPFGGARKKRSMICVENLCDAIWNIIVDQSDKERFQTWFVSDGEDITSGELYSMIFRALNPEKKGTIPIPELFFRTAGTFGTILERISGRNLPINSGVVSRLFDEYRFNSKAFASSYHWTPPLTTKEGIQKTVDWFLKQKEES